jgi:hypothetical protein
LGEYAESIFYETESFSVWIDFGGDEELGNTEVWTIGADTDFSGNIEPNETLEFYVGEAYDFFATPFVAVDDGKSEDGNGTLTDTMDVEIRFRGTVYELQATYINVPPEVTQANISYQHITNSNGTVDVIGTLDYSAQDPGIYDDKTVTVSWGDQSTTTQEIYCMDEGVSICESEFSGTITKRFNNIQSSTVSGLFGGTVDSETPFALYPVSVLVTDDDTGTGQRDITIIDVPVNDDHDLVPDEEDRVSLASNDDEDDLVQFNIGQWLIPQLDPLVGEFILSYDPSKIRLWDTATKENRFVPGYESIDAPLDAAPDDLTVPYSGQRDIWIEGISPGETSISLSYYDDDGYNYIDAGKQKINVLTNLSPGVTKTSEYYWGHTDQVPVTEGEPILWTHNDHLWEIGTNPAVRPKVQSFHWIAYPWDRRDEYANFAANDPLGEQAEDDELPIQVLWSGNSVRAATFTPPKGDWEIRAVARGSFGQAVTSPPRRFSIHEVTSVTWSGVEEEDGQTNFNHDTNVDWFHAERNSRFGPLHDSVALTVEIDPSIPGDVFEGDWIETTLHVQLYDPDNMLDDERDPNDTLTTAWGHDNLVGGNENENPRPAERLQDIVVPGIVANPNQLVASLPVAEFVFATGSQTAETEIVIVNRQPGNNFRAVVHDELGALARTDFPHFVGSLQDLHYTSEIRYQKNNLSDDYSTLTGDIAQNNVSRDLVIRRTLALEFDNFRQPLAHEVYDESSVCFSNGDDGLCDDPMTFRQLDPDLVVSVLNTILNVAAIDVSRTQGAFDPDDTVDAFEQYPTSDFIDSTFGQSRGYANSADLWSFQVTTIYELDRTQDHDGEVAANFGRSVGAIASVASEVSRDLLESVAMNRRRDLDNLMALGGVTFFLYFRFVDIAAF